MKKVSIIAGIMVLVFCVSVLAGASKAVLAQGLGCNHNGKGFWANLTDEQREAVREKISEMRDQDASPEETHAAVAELLKGYGIEVPEDWEGPHCRGDFGPPGPPSFFENLTEEQREAVQVKMEEMRSQNASPEETHAAVAEMLKGYGIEVPEKCRLLGSPGGLRHDRGGFMANLTEEQREAVREKMKEMRSQGSTREEIHTAVAEMFKGYGVELPQNLGKAHPEKHFLGNLTEEQREAVQNKIKELRNQGASHEEIRTAVVEMLKGYGIEPPEPQDKGPRGNFRGFLSNLTEEQRKAVREKIQEMRNQNASREEIRTAVRVMLEGYGIHSPQKPETNSSANTSTETLIKSQSSPNPFNPETEISYTLPENSYVSLTIYNIQGQKVKRLVNEYQLAGTRKVVWDGRDENGEGVASGVYLYRIEAGPNTVTNRMVLLK